MPQFATLEQYYRWRKQNRRGGLTGGPIPEALYMPDDGIYSVVTNQTLGNEFEVDSFTVSFWYKSEESGKNIQWYVGSANRTGTGRSLMIEQRATNNQMRFGGGLAVNGAY